MKRVTIRYRSAISKRRTSDAKSLAAFLEKLRCDGQGDEQIAIKLGTSVDSIRSWRMMRRLPKQLLIRGIESTYGVKIL